MKYKLHILKTASVVFTMVSVLASVVFTMVSVLASVVFTMVSVLASVVFTMVNRCSPRMWYLLLHH